EMNHFLCEIFSSSYNTLSAFDGKEGFAMATSLQPDLIISDIMMPEMSGDQMFRALRSQVDFPDTPFIFLTAKTDNDLRLQLLREGVQDYLTKPFLVEELLVRANNLIESRRAKNRSHILCSSLAPRPLEENSEQFFKSSREAVFIIKESGEIIYSNRSALDLFGYLDKELINQAFDSLVPESLREAQAYFRSANSKEKQSNLIRSQPFILNGIHKDGQIFPMSLSLNLISDEKAYYLMAIVRNMTNSQTYERQLKFLSVCTQIFTESTDNQRALKKVASYISEEIADGCIIRLEDKKLDYSLAALSHKNSEMESSLYQIGNAICTLANQPTKPPLLLRLKRGALYGRKIAADEFKLLNWTHSEMKAYNDFGLTSYLVLPLISHYKLLGFMILVSDKSNRIFSSKDYSFHEDIGRLIAFCIENSKLNLESMKAIKNQENILEILAHEFRNPLSVIKMSSQCLNSVGQTNTESIRRLSECIESSTEKLLSLLDKTLELAKSPASSLALDSRPKQVSDLGKAPQLPLPFKSSHQEKQYSMKNEKTTSETPWNLSTNSSSDFKVMDQKPPLGGKNILLVDDSSDLRLLMKHILETAGAKVAEADSVAAAMNYLETHFPDILITDIEMPNENGFDLIKQIKSGSSSKRYSFAKTPIAAITAHSRKEELDKIEQAGFDAYFLKPINHGQLVAQVQMLIERPINRALELSY
ncbi:MAG: response regulator, partial [Bdellovibrionales bacterium]|nr:response regulator [Bdellovibrionales bacterium]